MAPSRPISHAISRGVVGNAAPRAGSAAVTGTGGEPEPAVSRNRRRAGAAARLVERLGGRWRRGTRGTPGASLGRGCLWEARRPRWGGSVRPARGGGQRVGGGIRIWSPARSRVPRAYWGFHAYSVDSGCPK